MHKLTFVLGLAPLLAVAPAFAQASDSDTGEVSIDGRVASLCILGDASQAVVDLGQLIETSGSRVGRIDTIGARSVTLPDSFCNFAGSTLSVEATALVEDSAAVAATPSGFSRAVNFEASASVWGSGSADAATAAGADGTGPTSNGVSAVEPTPRITDIVVDLDGWSVPGDALLIAGSYSGLVRITLGPAAVTQ